MKAKNWLLLGIIVLAVTILSLVISNGVFQSVLKLPSVNVNYTSSEGFVFSNHDCRDRIKFSSYSNASAVDLLELCRVCVMNYDLPLVSSKDYSGYIDESNDFVSGEGFILGDLNKSATYNAQLLGDCELDTDSGGRYEYRYRAVPMSDSDFEDGLVLTTAGGRTKRVDDWSGYVKAHESLLVGWSEDYDYCPSNPSSYLFFNSLGACKVVVPVPPVTGGVVGLPEEELPSSGGGWLDEVAGVVGVGEEGTWFDRYGVLLVGLFLVSLIFVYVWMEGKEKKVPRRGRK